MYCRMKRQFPDRGLPDRPTGTLAAGTRRRDDSLVSEQLHKSKKARVSQAGEAEVAQIMVHVLPTSYGVV